MAYRDFKYLPRKTASDKKLRGKAFDMVKNSKYDEYQRGLASMFYKLFDNQSTNQRETEINPDAVCDKHHVVK